MAKRDLIEEIKAKGKRLHRRTDRYQLFEKRVVEVVSMFRAAKSLHRKESIRREMLRCVPIGYIACVEGYFRLLVADLINTKEEYRLNVVNLDNQLKFRADHVLALYDRKVTLGDYIAHLLPFNNLSDIQHNLSALIGKNFLDLFKQSPFGLSGKNVEEAVPKFISGVNGLFELRHLFAHELATKVPVRVRTIERNMADTAVFVILTEDLVSESLLF